jgi:hypothetical protein
LEPIRLTAANSSLLLVFAMNLECQNGLWTARMGSFGRLGELGRADTTAWRPSSACFLSHTVLLPLKIPPLFPQGSALSGTKTGRNLSILDNVNAP